MMTENNVRKALECCRDSNCHECPIEGCTDNIFGEALNLLNRKDEKIERLECEIGKLLPKDCAYAVQMEMSNELEKQIKSEAIKEFAEKLRNCFCVSKEYLDIMNIIDNLVKEMTEVTENDRA